jgi:C4-dicarboxylate-binding protein DctP
VKIFKLLAICAMVTLVFTPLSGAFTEGESKTNKKPIVMRCAGEFAPPELISVILEEMEAKVPQATGGRVKFEYYPAAQLYTFPDAIVALKAGDLEMGFNGMPISFFQPEWDVICGLPFLVNDLDHMMRFQETEAYKDLCARMEAKGIKPLTKVYPMDDQPLFNRKHPITRLEDLKGLKLSVGPSPTFIEATATLAGSKPINVPVPEVPSSLETGVIDCSPFPWPVQVFMDLPRLLPHVTEIPYGVSFPVGLVVSTKWWKTLPPDLQTQLQTIFADAMQKYGEEIVKLGNELQQKYADSPGTTVSTLSAAEQTRWIEALGPLYKKMRKKPHLSAIIDAAQSTK